MDLHQENDLLLQNLQECQVDNSSEPIVIKKGSKADIANEIFELCKKSNIPCEHTESQMKRMTKKNLLQILAEYCEKVVEKKIMEQCRIKDNIDHLETKQKTKLMNIGILRMAHDSLCFAAENLTPQFTPYSVEGFTKSMKNQPTSDSIDQCLAEIAEEYAILEYIESPVSRLMLIWFTSGISHLKKKEKNKNDNISKRLQSRPIKGPPANRNGIDRRPQARKIRIAEPRTETFTKRI